MKQNFILLLCLMLSVLGRAQQKTVIDPKVELFVKNEMKEIGIPGMAVAVVKDGKVLHYNTYGIANIEYDQPVVKNTSFQIASVSKLFTSTLVMKWCQENKLSLDDKISKYISDIPETWSKITIRHLMAHECGVPWPASLGGSIGISATEPFKVESMDTLVKRLKVAPMKFETGTKSAYVNGDYFLLQHIIEKLSGLSYPEVLKKEVFDPIGMTNSGYDLEQRDLRILTMAPLKYKSQNFTTGKIGPLIFKGFYAPTSYNAGGLFVSLQDALKWTIALDKHTFISAAMQEQMSKQTELKSGFTQLGWTTQTSGGYQVIGHSGGPGLGDVLRVSSEKLTVIVLSNFADMYPYIGGQILKLYLPNFKPQEMPKKLERELFK